MATAERFGHVSLPYACVTLDGFAIARLQYMHWEVIQHADADAMRAAREAIWSMPNNVSAESLRREICTRYLDMKGEG